MDKHEFVEFVRTGWREGIGPNGGYLVPNIIRCKTHGIKGWFWRFIGDKRGYYDYSFMDHLIERVKNG